MWPLESTLGQCSQPKIAHKKVKQEDHDGPGSLTHFSNRMNSTFFVPIVPTCDLQDGASFDLRASYD